MHRVTSLLFCALTVIASAANFIAPDAIDIPKLLPPPPEANSLVQNAELEVLRQLQAQRTPAQVAHANDVQDEDFFFFASPIIGDWFTAANLPKTAVLFRQAGDDTFSINRASKRLWNRPRPPFADASIQPAVKFSNSPSYPSGHAIQAAMWAILLSELFPEHAAAFAQRAAQTSWFRLVSGAHFPTDIEAGRILGAAIGRALLKESSFQQRLEQVRAEIAPFLLQTAA